MPGPAAPDKVWLIDWSPQQAAHAAALARLGYAVIRGKWNSAEISQLKKSPPSAVVIDLSRTPSRGRDVALNLRSHTARLPVPIVLAGGGEAALSQVRAGEFHELSALHNGTSASLSDLSS